MPTRRQSSLRDRALAVAPVVLMLAFVAWSVELFSRAEEGRAWVRHTEAVLTTASNAFAHLRDAETGERGFIITGDEKYLKPYSSGRDSVGIELTRLKTLTSDNKKQQDVLARLEPIAQRRLAKLDRAIDFRRSGDVGGASDIVKEGVGKLLMDSVRTLFADVQNEERRLLEQRSVQELADQDRLKVGLLLGVIFSTVIAYLVSRRFSRQAARQALVSEELAKRNNTLQEQAIGIEAANRQLQDQQVELETINRRLQEQQAEVEAANQQLQEQQLELELSADQSRDHAEQLAETLEQLQQANAAKGMFLANMSHELRTPLNAIAGHVQLIEMGLHGPVSQEQHAALDRIARAQRHLLSLINDVLNYTRLEAGRVPFSLTAVDVGQAMNDVSAMVEPQMQAAGLSFSSSMGTEPYVVWADEEKLRQILINLFSNATKFTPSGGRVSFGIAPHETNETLVELRVSDTGIGIPSDKLDEVFDPFVQLAAVTAPSNQGVGLGLAISRDLARGMGGELTVWSREELGSTFTLTLRKASAGEQDDRTIG
ncbi:MAG: CHASE3 domain-containing protein [bacterium]